MPPSSRYPSIDLREHGVRFQVARPIANRSVLRFRREKGGTKRGEEGFVRMPPVAKRNTRRRTTRCNDEQFQVGKMDGEIALQKKPGAELRKKLAAVSGVAAETKEREISQGRIAPHTTRSQKML